MNNKSYNQIWEQFQMMFPEFKKSVKEWTKDQFNKNWRTILIALKNGCRIYFGTFKVDDDQEWSWIATIDMSDKTKTKLGVYPEDEAEGVEVKE